MEIRHFLKFAIVFTENSITTCKRIGFRIISYVCKRQISDGAVAQLVRVPDCRSGGCGFESRLRRLTKSPVFHCELRAFFVFRPRLSGCRFCYDSPFLILVASQPRLFTPSPN